MNTPYTARQGQFLAFLHHYATLHGRPPAEAEMAQFFRITPPSAHLMVLTLERRGLIARVPGEARSIRLKLPPEQLPPLCGAVAGTSIRPPDRQDDGQQAADTQTTLVRLGKILAEDLFDHNARNPIDDSEFIPLVNAAIASFVRAGLSGTRVKELRRYACELRHRRCQQTEPESTFEENIKLMFGYLPSASRTSWVQSV